MPWRALPGEKPDAYHVWLSEIMLQQTTVVTVAPYYRKFIRRWPNIKALAEAKQEEVLSLWAGLGYYHRARNLHKTARIVAGKFNGIFPRTEEEIADLPGCGPYTAAAIAAIAFDRPANVVDGNVERVISRLFAVKTSLPKSKPKLKNLAASLLPKARFGDYAQALMDLGATVCTPRHPKCSFCPWRDDCKAKEKGIEESLPRRMRRSPKPTRRAIAFYLTNGRKEVLLKKRPSKGLLGGMMEIPSTEWQEGPFLPLKKAKTAAPAKADWRLLPGVIHHIFTHFELEMRVAVAATSSQGVGKWVKQTRLDGEALPTCMRKIIRHVHKAQRRRKK